jgi:hypothetical protein
VITVLQHERDGDVWRMTVARRADSGVVDLSAPPATLRCVFAADDERWSGKELQEVKRLQLAEVTKVLEA